MSMLRKSLGFLLGLAGLFGHARKGQLNTLHREGKMPARPRRTTGYQTRNKHAGIEQILACTDPTKRAYMVEWGNKNLRNASADTRRKWWRAAHDPSFRPLRRAIPCSPPAA